MTLKDHCRPKCQSDRNLGILGSSGLCTSQLLHLHTFDPWVQSYHALSPAAGQMAPGHPEDAPETQHETAASPSTEPGQADSDWKSASPFSTLGALTTCPSAASRSQE
ncbi:rCG22785 [Rattus norvegicus]|uniref:RCG22785 n=1 Tax=Rattus norvegicus TaxID=10116 RepID=A6JYK4_RAT|nr:rCG22785 [Rattus norvegicus]